MPTNDFDVRAARQRLEIAADALAAELGVAEGEVRAWESGERRIPRRARRMLEYRLAHADWVAGMRASGLPECEWMNGARATAVMPLGTEEMIRLANTLKAHMRACEVCVARERWAKEHLPPVPLPPATGVVGGAMAMVLPLPPWARPAAGGALVLGGITAVRVLFMVAALGWHWPNVLQAAGAVLVAAGAGAAGGLAYSLTRPATHRLGAAGDYLSGVIAVAGYLGAALMVLPLFGAERMLADPVGLGLFAFVSVLFGTVVGKIIHDDARLGRAMEREPLAE